jgi:hypothetical protein
MRGNNRPKDGVASLVYGPALPAQAGTVPV